MSRLQVWWAVALVSVLGCTSRVPSESELALACFAGVELEAWDLRFSSECSAETDEGADGDIDTRRSSTFDDEGRLLSQIDRDGAEHRVERDDRGRVVLEEDRDADGAVLWRSSTVFEDRSARSESDSDGDGITDSIAIYDYACFDDDEEEWPGFCVMSIDQGADGDFDSTVTNEWSEDGVLVST